MIPYEGRNRRTVNYLKNLYFDRPEWTPCRAGIMPGTWAKYREDLEALVLAHPRLWPGFRKGSVDFDDAGGRRYETGRMTDCWGCVWENVQPGLVGQVVGHPLADWDALESYEPPDPMTEDRFGPRRDWEEVRQRFEAARARGDLARTSPLAHGFMYMYLYYLRGFENFMLDLATGDPRLDRLVRMVEGYNTAVVRKVLDLGAEYVSFGDDLGLQRSLPMSPRMWRERIKPSYARIIGLCREAGAEVYLHTDGHILEIIPDLVEVGVGIVNPQIGANGLEGLRDLARGRICIDLDLDRQMFPFATPDEVEDHIGEMVEGLRLEEGGLMVKAECGPDVPLETIDRIASTLERLGGPAPPDA